MLNRSIALLTGVMFAAVLAITALRAPEAQAHASFGPGCCEAPKCDYNPCIKYVHRGHKKACCDCRCAPPQNIVLTVQDPCCCDCAVEIPMCIPACCEGEPCVKSRCGVLGRGVVWYEWCCGFKARVAFSKCGDITVTYFGHR